jgi:hypothetical protein
MGLEQNVDVTKKDKYITSEIWQKAKGMAALRGLKVGQWLAEAILEKYDRELTEAKSEKRT